MMKHIGPFSNSYFSNKEALVVMFYYCSNQNTASCETREGVSYQSGIEIEGSMLNQDSIQEIPAPFSAAKSTGTVKHGTITEIFFDTEATGLSMK